jgi:diguanylate cyclase (GGDEF)-like protein
MTTSDLEAKLAEIKQAYQAELPSKTYDLKAVWKDIQGGWGADRMQELHRLAHSLAGSGATFGFQNLSTRARALEIELKALLHDEANDVTETRNRLPALCELLIGAMQAASVERTKPKVALPSEMCNVNDNRPLYLLGQKESDVLDLVEQLGYYGYAVNQFTAVAALASALATQTPAGVVVAQDPDQAVLDLLRPLALEAELDDRLPVVVVTDHFGLDVRLAAVRAGCGAFFTWPVDAGVVANRLNQLTHRQVSEPYRILVIEDEIELADHYAALLREAGFSVRVVNEPLQAMQILSEFNPELILMDIYMPDCSGIELAAVIRQEDAYVGVPIVYLSSETNLAKQIDAMRQGGDEFLTKPIEPHLLVASVRCRVQRSRMLGSFLHRDSLTGLLNHTSSKEALETEVERARRRGTPFTFAMIDIDHFKNINDTYGHPVGDRVIKSLSRLLQQRLRKTDVIGRFGGEEFAVLLPDTALESALPVLEQLRESFENIRQTIGGTEFSVSFSCGVTSYPEYQTADNILYHADAALYRAKHGGRNSIVIAN